MSSLKFALMLMACGMATAFVFHKECEPKDSTAIELTGASLTVRVWVPESSDDEILRLFIIDDNLAFTNISINEAVVTIENEGQHREINIFEEYNKTIPRGWTEFQVTVDREFDRIRVFVPAINLTIVDEDDFVEDDSLHIEGKQVTVNCFTSLTQWRVALGSPASVPLAGLGPHHFALFSRKAFLPSLRAGSLRLHLHWDPESETVSVSSSNPQPLPAFTLHNFALKCELIPKNWKCDVMWENGGHGTLVGLVLLKEVGSLSFEATDKIDYVVQFILKDQETTIEEKLLGKSENGAGEDDEKRPCGVDGCLTPINLVVLLILCVRGRVAKYRKKLLTYLILTLACASHCWPCASHCWACASHCWPCSSHCWPCASHGWPCASHCWPCASHCWACALHCWPYASHCWSCGSRCWSCTSHGWSCDSHCWSCASHCWACAPHCWPLTTRKQSHLFHHPCFQVDTIISEDFSDVQNQISSQDLNENDEQENPYRQQDSG